LLRRLAITMAADFRIVAVEDALAKPGPPDIFNPDQGRQFTGVAFAGMRRKSGIAIGDRIAERDRFGSRSTAKAPILHQTWRDPDLAWQCLCRAALAVGQNRGGLSRRPRSGVRSANFDRLLSRFLSERKATFAPRPADARSGLLQPAAAWASWRWARQENHATAVDMTLWMRQSLANANPLPTSLRWPFHAVSPGGTFGQLRPPQEHKTARAAR
jgi:hypothetical protein